MDKRRARDESWLETQGVEELARVGRRIAGFLFVAQGYGNAVYGAGEKNLRE
jgi:hypothetical protein